MNIALLGFGLLTGWPCLKWIIQGSWKVSLMASLVVNGIAACAIAIFLLCVQGFELSHASFFTSLSETLFSWCLSYFLALLTCVYVQVIALSLFCESDLAKIKGIRAPSSTVRMWIGLGAANILTSFLTYSFSAFL